MEIKLHLGPLLLSVLDKISDKISDDILSHIEGISRTTPINTYID